MTQVVKTALGTTAGIILSEAKNAQWQASWQPNSGPTCARPVPITPDPSRRTCQTPWRQSHTWTGREWAARPAAVGALATMLRQSIIHAHDVTRLHESSDEKSAYRSRMSPAPSSAIGSIGTGRVHGVAAGAGTPEAGDDAELGQQDKAVRCQADSVMGLSGDFVALAGPLQSTTKVTIGNRPRGPVGLP